MKAGAAPGGSRQSAAAGADSVAARAVSDPSAGNASAPGSSAASDVYKRQVYRSFEDVDEFAEAIEEVRSRRVRNAE